MNREVSNRPFRVQPTERTTFYPRVFGRRGAVASEHYLASLAGIEILKQGGNAIDAAVATTLVEGLVNPHMHTIGGEIPMLIVTPGSKQVTCINGNMVAPEAATPKAFRDRGFEKIPGSGIFAAGVPGAMGALLEAVIRFGRLSFGDVSAPALELARHGYPVHSGILRAHKFGILDNLERFRTEWHGTAQTYLPDGDVPNEGDLLCNTALADMFFYLAREEKKAGGTREKGLKAAFNAFYKGDVASAIVKFVSERDGLLKRSDLERFRVPVERSTSIKFGGAELHKTGPWTQGPAVLQTLSILKNVDLRKLGHNSIEYIHTVVEAMKLAYADREQFYGDPEHVDVPMKTLLSDEYGRMRAGLLGTEANGSVRPGDPLRKAALLPMEERLGGSNWGPGTVHVDVMDQDGHTAAFTPSGAYLMGSEVIPSLGFPLGVRLANCQLGPRHHPNIVAPFKRPRTTISPSLATKDGQAWLAFGSMGGDQQDQWQLQFFLNRTVFDMPVQDAIEAPKFTSDHFPGLFHPHNFYLNRLRVEENVGKDTISALHLRGHDIDEAPAWTEGFLCCTERHHATGMLEAGCDPRGTKSEIFPASALAY